MDSGQFAKLRHQQFQEGSEQVFTSDADLMHELKEAQVERQFLLGNPSSCKFPCDPAVDQVNVMSVL